MKVGLLGVLLAVLALSAHADDLGKVPFHGGASLARIAETGTDPALSYYTPDGAWAATNADQIELARQRQLAAMREQIYEAIGIADYLPRGEFLIGGLKTSWHLNASRERTIAFSLEARW